MKLSFRGFNVIFLCFAASGLAVADGFWDGIQGPEVIEDRSRSDRITAPAGRDHSESPAGGQSTRSLSVGDIGALQQAADYYEARTRLTKAQAEYEQAKCELSNQCGAGASAAAVEPTGPVGPFVLSILGSPNRGFTADLLIDGARVSVRERDILKAGLEVFEINSFGVKLRDGAGRLRELPMIGLILTD